MAYSITRNLSAAIHMTLAMSGSAQAAKIIPGQNIKTFAAACARSSTCINWGDGLFSNEGVNVSCNKKKCVNHQNPPSRTDSNGNRSNDPSGSTVNDDGSNGDVAGSAGGSPSSMGGDSGPSID